MTTDGFITCLWFDGQAEEAADHYVSIFRNAAIGRVTHYDEAGMGTSGDVLTVEFTANGHPFVALNGGPQFRFTEAVSFQILCADQDEIDYYWSRLAEGGEEGRCGWLKDRFGVSWQVLPAGLTDMIADPDPEAAARATRAMLASRKFDIAALEKAHAGG
ncbi:VOC family protein [Streptomyces poriticola]|uniref:VOC family protein n=1 Tax=Streptomyces poriticola TaxID=3120506 RepID=UPI002FCE0A0D